MEIEKAKEQFREMVAYIIDTDDPDAIEGYTETFLDIHKAHCLTLESKVDEYKKLYEQGCEIITSMEDNEKALREALFDAVTGLEWWMSEYPEGIGKEDAGRIEGFKNLLNQ